MRPADERFSASTISMISIRWSLVGAQVDCSTNTSLPRTFSLISTMISPSENRLTTAMPSGIPSSDATPAANSGVAVPVNTIRFSWTMIPESPTSSKSRYRQASTPGSAASLSAALLWRAATSRRPGLFGRGTRIRTLECRNQNPVP